MKINPKWLIYLQALTMLLCPLYIVRFKIGFLPSTLLEVLIGLTILTFISLSVVEKDWLGYLKSDFNLPIVIFLLAAGISTIVSVDKLGALGILKAYFVEPILFFYSLLYSAKKSSLKLVVYGLVGAGVWLSLLAILQKITRSFTPAPIEIAQDRVTAVFNSANSLALFLGPVLILVISFWVIPAIKQHPGVVKRGLSFLLLPLFFIVMIWTKSRGGVVALLVGLGISSSLLIPSLKEIIRQLWLGLVLVLAAAISIFLVVTYQNYNPLRLQNDRIFNKPDTMQIRLAVWAGTIRLLKDHPIFGAGLDGFKSLYSTQYKITSYQEDVQYPHNIVLTFWSETGLLGLFAFTLLIVVYLHQLWLKLWKSKNPAIGAGLIGAMVFLLIHGVVDVPYFKNDLSLEFWLILALAQAYLNSDQLIW